MELFYITFLCFHTLQRNEQLLYFVSDITMNGSSLVNHVNGDVKVHEKVVVLDAGAQYGKVWVKVFLCLIGACSLSLEVGWNF